MATRRINPIRRKEEQETLLQADRRRHKRAHTIWESVPGDEVPYRMKRETDWQCCPMPQDAKNGDRAKQRCDGKFRPKHVASTIGNSETDIGATDQRQCDGGNADGGFGVS